MNIILYIGATFPICACQQMASDSDRIHIKTDTMKASELNSVVGFKVGTDEEVDDFFTYLNSELSRSTNCYDSGPKPSRGGGGYYSHLGPMPVWTKQWRE